MKNSTRLATLLFVAALFALVNMNTTGCSAVAHKAQVEHAHGHKAMVKAWKPGKRCRTLGTDYNRNVAVIVQKNCVRNGITSVGMVVLNTARKGTVAAKDAVFMIKRILGFDPVLKALLVGKDKGKVFMLTVVTGVNGVTVAGR